MVARVTRLDEFSPLGGLFTWDNFDENYRRAQSLGLIFLPREKSYIGFDKKIGWATLWAIFSQTHLVTLTVARIYRQTM
jgi:hypothetical protein